MTYGDMTRNYGDIDIHVILKHKKQTVTPVITFY